MKRIALYFGIVVAMAVSCSIQWKNFETPQQDDVIFYASFERPTEQTKVYANDDLYLRWTADDRVSIFNKLTYNQQYKFLGETGDNSGGFNRVDAAEFVTGNEIPHVVSVYPYQEGTKITEEEVLTLTLPAEQHYAVNTFGLGANTMVSVSSDNILQYKNVGGFLRISLYGENVKVSSITLKGNNGEKLAGKATITMPLNGVPSAVLANDASDVITLVFDSPTTLGATAEESKDFWFVVPPISFSHGFTISITQANGGVYEKATSNSIAIERSYLSKMAPIEIVVEQVLPVGNIDFADAIAKYACVEKFDTDGDGEVSYAEAAAATSLKGLFTDWNTVTSFDEIRFFTGVTSTEGVFTGCSKLTQITIPDWISTLGTFQNCSSLSAVTLPAGIVNIPNYCFQGCTALTNMTLPSTVKSLGNYSFYGCSSLSGIALPSNLESIGKYAFSHCSGLTSVVLPDSLTSLGEGSFVRCTALTSVVLPAHLTSIPYCCFSFCTALSSIVWPQSLTTIGDSAFYESRFMATDYSLELPSSVTSIGVKAFGLLHHLIIPSELFVSIASGSFVQNYTFLYVPDNLVELYKVRTNWSDYSDHIKPISEYPIENAVGGTVGEAIDLGLSVKWASWNVGASAPEEYGTYFAWGETKPIFNNIYFWGYYKWSNDGEDNLTKYNTNISYGVVDNKTTLDSEDDAAYVNWGGSWRMPTPSDYSDLINNCTVIWTTENGVDGCRFTSNKPGYTDKSIFIPAAGVRCDDSLSEAGIIGEYWSSSLRTDIVYNASTLIFGSSGGGGLGRTMRCYGLPIRPVCD